MTKNVLSITNDDIDKMNEQELRSFIDEASIIEHQYDKMQHSAKILLNSLYGALGTKYFRFFNVWMAEAITMTGQSTTAQSFEVMNDFMTNITKKDKDYAIASDTDSVYVDITEAVEKLFGSVEFSEDTLNSVTNLCDVILNEKLEKRFEEFSKSINAYKNTIVMKREAIAHAIFIAKKNYIMMVYDNEGVRYAKPKLKITGLEAVKSSTPKLFQKHLKDAYKVCFGNDESLIHKKVKDVYEASMNLLADDIAGISTANNLDKFDGGDGTCIKGTPKHVRGSIVYNYLVKDSSIHEPIQSGDKVKVVELIMPNPTGAPVLAYKDKFPSDLISEKYVNKEENYKKYFIKPITRVLDVKKWSTERKVTLESLFT